MWFDYVLISIQLVALLRRSLKCLETTSLKGWRSEIGSFLAPHCMLKHILQCPTSQPTVMCSLVWVDTQNNDIQIFTSCFSQSSILRGRVFGGEVCLINSRKEKKKWEWKPTPQPKCFITLSNKFSEPSSSVMCSWAEQEVGAAKQPHIEVCGAHIACCNSGRHSTV